MKSAFLAIGLAIFSILLSGYSELENTARVTYQSPKPGAAFVLPETTIAFRLDRSVDPATLDEDLLNVNGSASGFHDGEITFADDGRTWIFKSHVPFEPGETVVVEVLAGLRSQTGGLVDGMEFSFHISPRDSGLQNVQMQDLWNDFPDEGWLEREFSKRPDILDQVDASPAYHTLPDDFPTFAVTSSLTSTIDGYIFSSPFQWPRGEPGASYLLVMDNQGEPVFYRRFPGSRVYDFKKQPNGQLTYFDDTNDQFVVLDSSYNVVESFGAGNGYTADVHDLELLPNGHALFMIYDPQPVDMSAIVPGGSPTATVVGLVIQELDASRNVVFQWRSWDYFDITDTSVDLTAERIDYVHGNAITQDTDGNLLVSNRHFDEITKIDRETGEIIWRLGGKKNQFTFLEGALPFFHQHDIRRLENGNISLFDNRTGQAFPYSRAVEFTVNEEELTISQAWQFRNTPDTYSFAMGNAQRLPNGNTLIGWGTAYPSISEVSEDGEKVFELTYALPYTSYRGFRFPWEGEPSDEPVLVLEPGLENTLYFSWNGATDVTSFNIYAGSNSQPNILINNQMKDGFETSMILSETDNRYCSFQVVPLNAAGEELTPSNLVFSDAPCQGKTTFLPLIANN